MQLFDFLVPLLANHFRSTVPDHQKSLLPLQTSPLILNSDKLKLKLSADEGRLCGLVPVHLAEVLSF
jgi:hypothetical protein